MQSWILTGFRRAPRALRNVPITLWMALAVAGLAAPLATLRAANDRPPLMISAHRGDIGSVDSQPENTIEAVVQAMRKGADWVEVDVARSADGSWWILHDDTVDRTTNGRGSLGGLTDAQLRALRIDGGAGYEAARHGESLRLPSLFAMMTAIRPFDATLQLSVKEEGVEAHAALARAIDMAGMADRVAIRAFDLESAVAVKGVDPSIQVVIRHASTTSPGANVDMWSAPIGVVWSSEDVKQIGKPVQIYMPLHESGEAAWMERAFDWGVAVFMTNHLDAALELNRRLNSSGDGGIQESSRILERAS